MTAEPYYVISQCPCGSPFCTDWHVDPVAAVQGVKFTKAQAKAVANLLNGKGHAHLLAISEALAEALKPFAKSYGFNPPLGYDERSWRYDVTRACAALALYRDEQEPAP